MTRPRQPQGLALVAVLVVMGGALLVATSLLFVGTTEHAGVAGEAVRLQSHATAWSGVRAAMARLDEQRDTILAGMTPTLDQEMVIYETPARLGVARLLPVGPGDERVVPEASHLDLEHVDAERLAATGLVDETLAEAVVEHRDALGRPYQSVGELLEVQGLSAETLHGPLEEIAEPGGPDEGERDPAPRGLADVVTVFGVEPALQMDGRRRINLNVPWSEELGERVAQRFGVEVAETLQRIMEAGTTFETEARIFQVLNFFDVPVNEWPQIADTFTADEGEFHFGRLDINTASYEALLGLPGFGPEQAAAIVRTREGLSDDERATVAWPAIQEIVAPEAYEELAGFITTRSWTYRLRVAGGEVPADDPDAPLAGEVIYEVVIDLAAPRARVAYLREVTWLAATALVAASVETPEAPEDQAEPPDRADAEPLAEAQDAETKSAATADQAIPGLPDGEPEQPPGGEQVSEGEDDEQPQLPPPPPGPPPSPPRTRIGRWTAG